MFQNITGMLSKIPGYVNKNSGKCYQRFRGMLKMIPGNVNFDFFS